MTGESQWMDPLLMILGGLGVVFMVWLGSRVELLRRRRRQLLCPKTGKPVRCTLVQDTLTKDWVDLEQCSVFGPTQKVPCNKACLSPLNGWSRPTARP